MTSGVHNAIIGDLGEFLRIFNIQGSTLFMAQHLSLLQQNGSLCVDIFDEKSSKQPEILNFYLGNKFGDGLTTKRWEPSTER